MSIIELVVVAAVSFAIGFFGGWYLRDREANDDN